LLIKFFLQNICENMEFLENMCDLKYFRSILSLLSCTDRTVLSVLSTVTCHGDLSRLNCLCWPVSEILSHLSCHGCPGTVVPSRVPCPNCAVFAVMFRLSGPLFLNCPLWMSCEAALSPLTCLAIFSQLSCTRCPFLADLPPGFLSSDLLFSLSCSCCHFMIVFCPGCPILADLLAVLSWLSLSVFT
jgi:hypothetical protein